MSQDMFTKADLDELNLTMKAFIATVHRIGGDVGIVMQLPDRREHIVQPLSTAWAAEAFKRARKAAKARLRVIDADAIETATSHAKAQVERDAKLRARAEAEAEQEGQSADE